MLVQLNYLRSLFGKLGWDQYLPDQMNILGNWFHHNILEKEDTQEHEYMSIFFHKQTNQCYLVCERSYFRNNKRKIEQTLGRITNYCEKLVESQKQNKLFTTEALNSPDNFIAKRKFAFSSLRDLVRKLDELRNKYCIDIIYISNILGSYKCEISVCLPLKYVIKKKRYTLESTYDFLSEQIKTDKCIGWFDYTDINLEPPYEITLTKHSQFKSLAYICSLLEVNHDRYFEHGQ